MSAQPVAKSARQARIRAAAVEALESRRYMAIDQWSSLPGAPRNLYLDFDGDAAADWNNGTQYRVHGPAGINDPVPAFNWDGVAGWNATELGAREQIYRIVAEKYSPFGINVTTVDPGNVTNDVTEKVIIGGTPRDWFQPDPVKNPSVNSGVSAIGGFADANLPNTTYVFGNRYVNNAFFVGNVAAHEAGHAFGLVHERWNQNPAPVGNNNYPEYYFGDATRSPIMGDSGNNSAGRGIWWKTNNWSGQNSPDATQDEINKLAILLGYRSDHWSSSNPGTLQLDGNGNWTEANGVIRSTSEVDPFNFNATGSTATFYIDNAQHYDTLAPAQYGGMLAPTARIRIRNTSTYIPINLSLSNTRATITANSLVAGQDYVLEVGSQGNYGDIGWYHVTGQMQSFATYSPASRTLYVGGIAADNNLTVQRAWNPNTQAYAVEVSSITAAGSATQYFPVIDVDRVRITLGNGADTIKVGSIFKLDNTPVPVSVDAGGGNDKLRILDPLSFCTYTVKDNLVTCVVANSRTSTLDFNDVQTLELEGSSSADRFDVRSMTAGAQIVAYGNNSDDVMNIAAGALRQIVRTTFIGGQGTDSLTLDWLNQGSGGGFGGEAPAKSFNVWSDFVSSTLDFTWNEFHYDSAVENVNILGGTGNDNVNVYILNPTTTVTFSGDEGNDHVDVGYVDPANVLHFSDSVKGKVKFLGSLGTDSIVVHDEYADGTVTYTLSDTSLRGSNGGVVEYDTGVESLYLAGNTTAACTYTVQSSSSYTATTIQAGGLGDQLNVQNSTGKCTLNGGAGNDTFYVSDPAVMLGYYSTTTLLDGGPGTIDSIQFNDSAQTFLTQRTLTSNGFAGLSYANFDGMSILLGAGHDGVFVQSTPANCTIAVYGQGGNDGVSLSNNNSVDQIRSKVAFDGGSQAGSDSVIIIDTASTANHTWTFNNGAIVRDGVALVSMIANETLTLSAGSGADTFDIQSLPAPTRPTIYGGGGEDSVIVSAAAMPSFEPWGTFDGQGGIDRVTLNDAGSGITQRVNYSVVTGASPLLRRTLLVQDPFDPTWWDSYPTSMNIPSIEIMTINAGTRVDTLDVVTQKSTPQVVHLDQRSIGAYTGDTYFGAGGGLFFSNINNLNLGLTGAADTVYAQPNPTAVVTMDGGSPTISPGDRLILALAAAQNRSINSTGTGSGTVTSSNLKTLTYSGFESVTNPDNIAPVMLSGRLNLDGITLTRAVTRQQAVDVQFSENIGLINTASIELTNLTTGQVISQTAALVSFDAGTNIAHFTFPGLSGAALPDGNYRGRVIAGRSNDLVGNGTAADASFDFFVLSGDANHDRKVDVVDLGILASNWQLTGRTFSQGDFNYDGRVDVVDLGILATKWQGTLALPSAPFASTPTKMTRVTDQVMELV
jgi:hypothetical protein